ncbi:winged helix-turn-helix transcriptional regulator [Curvivirga aplysinae]|uniref:winged helix-turn-helix transcriptional regulator n=1 Tax=Curvivirga aplysinae TaxID=2529852 RepID=UPI0012BD7B74|nr:winged helix-turn-helix transcriptional regulator [Curvivirga aplysinae]MTI11381.1 winged helix-turn-helix transcriptional regulator [Curvivirga aplysinae]
MSNSRVLREILVEIERDPTISQKKISESVGISVGMVNWHIKRCVNKGFIKLQQAPVRRYFYYLTPDGFAEKANLTADYLRSSFDIFKAGRRQYEELFQLCKTNRWHSVAFLGESELSELALLVATKHESIDLKYILNLKGNGVDSNEIPVLNIHNSLTLKNPVKIDALIGTDFELRIPGAVDINHISQSCDLDSSRVLIPAFLK